MPGSLLEFGHSIWIVGRLKSDRRAGRFGHSIWVAGRLKSATQASFELHLFGFLLFEFEFDGLFFQLMVSASLTSARRARLKDSRCFTWARTSLACLVL